MGFGKTGIIACKTVINEMRPFLPSEVICHTVEAGLHMDPAKMRKALQAIVERISADAETIILGYGLCSMGVIGLQARHSRLIIPRRDDCIAILLGSRLAYLKELNQEPGTYFLSKGWIDAGITLLDELEKMRLRCGEERADRVMARMLRHYRRLVFINMGYSDPEPYRRFSRKAAKVLNLDYQEIRGAPEFLSRLCNGPWEDDFVVAPAGHIINLADFKMIGSRYPHAYRSSGASSRG
jgi:hypothetical protein